MSQRKMSPDNMPPPSNSHGAISAASPCRSRAASASASAAQLVVARNKTARPIAAFTQIQAAINAANPGDHNRICAGTYAEQLTIAKPLGIDAENGAILQP